MPLLTVPVGPDLHDVDHRVVGPQPAQGGRGGGARNEVTRLEGSCHVVTTWTPKLLVTFLSVQEWVWFRLEDGAGILWLMAGTLTGHCCWAMTGCGEAGDHHRSGHQAQMSVSRVTSMRVSVSAIRVLIPLTPLSSLTAQLGLGTGTRGRRAGRLGVTH